MQISKLTVAQIEQLLSGECISEKIISQLRNDARVSVARLLNKWHKRQTAIHNEYKRIQGLYKHERALRTQGYTMIAGIDEAGRGPLAGPVVVGAVILPPDYHIPMLNDSKKLTAKQRAELSEIIKDVAFAVNYTVIDVETIDQVNIYQATVQGMYQAVAGLYPAPNAVLIDAVSLPELSMHSLSLIGGDAISASIAAASIIAKVERDRIMEELDRQYPVYGFAQHKGYPTAEHIRKLQLHGPCPVHRRSFEPIKSWGTI